MLLAMEANEHRRNKRMMRELNTLETPELEIQELDDASSTVKPTKTRSNLLAPLVVGVVMLGIGLLAGYFGRPLVNPEPTPAPAVALADPENQAGAASAGPAVPDPSGPSLVDGVISQTRHFRGEPGAPITVIEFGDFQ
jgi:hypothetical protein